jgi:aminoglycoside phosphotransferase
MPRKDTATYNRVPSSLAPVLRSFVERFGEPERWARTEVHRPWVVITPEHVAYLAHDDPSLKHLDRERTRLLWARDAGIPVPEVIETSDTMLVTARSPADHPTGATYVQLAIEAAGAIAAADPPELSASSRRSAPASTLLVRGLRSIAGRLDPRRFIEARRAASQLSHDTLSHGDFHPNNVLFDAQTARVTVIDWSYLGFQPLHSDLIYFWTRLADTEDRALLADRLVETSDDPFHLAILLRWISIRSFAEMLADVPWGKRDRAKLALGRAVMHEGEETASRLERKAGAR